MPGLAMVACVTTISLLAIASPSSVAYRGSYQGRCVWESGMGFVDVAAPRPPYVVLCRSDEQCEEGQLCLRSAPHKNLHTPPTNSHQLAGDPFGSFSDSCLAILQVRHRQALSIPCSILKRCDAEGTEEERGAHAMTARQR